MKHYIKATMSLFLLALLCTLVFAACKQKEVKEPGMLATPEGLRVEDEVLRWNAVENAAGYVVEIDGVEYEVAEESYDTFLKFTKSRKYSIRVKAQSDLGEYEDSAWTEILEYSPVCATGWVLRPINDGTEYEVVGDSKATLKGKLLIPGEYDGKKVTRIAQDAFKDCTKLTGVVIPSSVVQISQSAFSGCVDLRRVALPDSIEKIYSYAFSECHALSQVKLPPFITNIGISAFYGCCSLEEIDLPEYIERLNVGVFGKCDSLKKITISKNVKYIASTALMNCKNPVTIIIDEENPVYRSEGNSVILKENDALVLGFAGCPIPESVKIIAGGAFAGCKDTLTEIVVPGNVKIIWDGAFSNCSKLRSITLCEGIQAIGNPDGSNEGCRVFDGCVSLSALEIPASVEYIGDRLFVACTNLQSLTVAPGNTAFRGEGNCIIRNADQMLLQGSAAAVIPAGVKGIGMCAFAYYPHAEIVIPEGVESIGRSAFRQSALVRVTLPNTLKTIGEAAFLSEEKSFFSEITSSVLREINLPDGLITIEAGALAGNWQLEYLVIPESVISIGHGAFHGCYSLTLLLPDSVKEIGGAAFEKVKQLFTNADYNNLPEEWINEQNTEYGCWNYNCSKIVYNCTFVKEAGDIYISSIAAIVKVLRQENYKDRYYYNLHSYILPLQRKGYTFAGFSTDPNSNTVEYLAQIYPDASPSDKTEIKTVITEKQLKSLPEGTTILYAVWRANEA